MSNVTISQQLPPASGLIVLIVFACLFSIVGIFRNACVIIYNVLLHHSNTPTSHFVVNLAINDFFACCIIYAIWMTIFIRSALRITIDPKLFCSLAQNSHIGVIHIFWTILVITVDELVLHQLAFKVQFDRNVAQNLFRFVDDLDFWYNFEAI